MTTAPRIPILLTCSALVVALTGCAATVAEPAPSTESTPSPSATATSDPDVPVVAGFAAGEFPAVPLFQLPDLSLLDASADGFTLDIRDDFAVIPGVTVTPAHCDAAGSVVAGSGSAYLYGDGAGNYTGADGEIWNYGDGAGSFTLNGVTVDNFGDGSGSYDDGTVSIFNYGDGAATYKDANLDIHNYGDGTATVNGTTIDAEPVPPSPALGVFPPLAALQPIASCGTVITFSDGVLFDFDKSDIRPDAADTLVTVAEALSTYEVASAVVSGHTDAIGSDSDNQTLSEERAASVVAALEKAGVTTALTSEGHGESRPVAANEVDGEDNPAGRQLNRRVEIFIPAAL